MAKTKNKLDGFRKVGEVLVCMLCNAELGPVEAADSAGAAQANKKINDLSLLLGAAPSAPVRLAAAEDEKRFCKDCVHFLPHPFVNRCDLDNHPVEVMDDCPEYKRKIKQ
ncbi:MAG: hypothetical protein E7052_09915 [Lentisphaerae bacterium]|nr:hypothetical protein [Lentisphaerota bacterium]